MEPVALGSSSELMEHCPAMLFVGLMVGSNERYGWVVGQKPGQPVGFAAVGVCTKLAVALLITAKCWRRGTRMPMASAPVLPSGLSRGAKRNEVPAPDSK